MVASTLRLVDGDEELELSGTHGSSPILVVDSEFTSASPRVVDAGRIGRSGRRDLTSLHDSSEFTASLKIQGDDDMSRYDYLDLLKSFMSVRKRPYLYVWREGWLNERRAVLRGNDTSCVIGKKSGQFLDVSLRAAIPDGVLESNESITVTLQPGVTNDGWDYPFSYPEGYDPSATANSSTVWLLGNTVSPPYIRIYGQCTNPIIQVTREDNTSSQIALTGIDIPTGSFLDIDVANRTVFLNGDQANSYYSKVNFTVTDWWELEPSENRLLFSASGANSSCIVQITYRDLWTP